MPDAALHHAFGQEVREALPPEIQAYFSDAPYTFALYGPDPWFMYRPWTARRQGRGRRMHTTKTGAFLTELARQARDGTAPRETFSYLAGFLCHYALDSTAHPYIIWQTTETWPTKRAHRDMEHALDILLLQREGFWGETHPLTDHHFPKLRLPEEMAGDLDTVYGKVYGWTGVLKALNRCCRQYRWLFRQMEKPRSLLVLTAAVIPTHRLRSVPHARCAFLDRDTENLQHAPWHQAYAREETSNASFPELYGEAKNMAVRLIEDCYAYAVRRNMEEGALRERIGNRSYLSGLDADDPRNMLVKSLQPPE